ncbi:unnamed protein product [Caenorhabditis angaria]|uniref:Methyltransferase FkbM domain-containing protein n=1 Tax=Caenorhabditis angaria TaxID=860376 RepID=A0A9P1IPF6_9PELO|nr:unnamed protein product [Caenorhabditis angaria]
MKLNTTSVLIFLLSIFIFSLILIRSKYQVIKVITDVKINEDVEIYARLNKIKMRQIALNKSENSRNELKKLSLTNDSLEFYRKIEIEAFCPNIVRIGEIGDGGKFVCNPKKVRENCVLLSLGLHNEIEYDIMIQNITENRCQIVGADQDRQNDDTLEIYKNIRGTVFVGKIPKTLSIAGMVQRVGGTEVELLKIDIEGGEHKALEPFLKNFFVCQIFIEVHGEPKHHLNLMQKVAKLGFRIFSYEPNPSCSKCCEYSYINEMCMDQYNVLPLAVNVPFE